MTTKSQLSDFGQDHLLQFEGELTGPEKAMLQSQIEAIDFPQLKALISGEDKAVDWGALAEEADAPSAAELGSASYQAKAKAIDVGEKAIRAGRVGMILVAGGQGSRLGFDRPKGLFPVGPISHRTLFQMHVDRLKAVMRRYEVSIPMYVMTSPATDQETREYFDENDSLGLSQDELQVFCQGTMPAVDAETGKVLLASKSSIALSPDGHGGLVAALEKNGCLQDAANRGIDYFYYAQVDNPMAQLCDPELIGHHILQQSEMTTQVVRKRFPTEKVGNVVSIDGKTQIIEYSDLPESAAEQTQADGSLKLWAGNIAIHVFDRAFLESVVGSAQGLPFHRAHKKVAHVNSAGELVNPETPNATKFERFVFDLLPMAERAFVVEGDAAEVFAPVKNANGAEVDTPEACQAALLALHRSWLEEAGATVAENARVEIHPGWALDAADVKLKVEQGTAFNIDTFLQ